MGCIIGVSTSMKPRASKILAHRLDDLGALDEDLAHLGIDNQIDVALAVAHLHVLQAVPLLRKRQQVLGQERDLVDVNRQFVGLGAEQVSAHADVVADIEQLEQLEALFADRVLLDVELQPLALLLQVDEGGLAHGANGDQAAGHPHIHPVGGQGSPVVSE